MSRQVDLVTEGNALCAIGRALRLNDAAFFSSSQRWPLATVCPVSSGSVPTNTSGVPVWCNWQSVHCDSSSKSVVSFDINNNGAIIPQSTIPSALGLLPNLRRIKLAGGSLNGSIPMALGSLSQLTLLDLSYNKLTGTIPSLSMQFVPARSKYPASQLILNSNYLIGTVPSFVSNLRFTYLGNERRQFNLENNCDLQSTLRAIRDGISGQGNCPPPGNLKGKNGHE